jgi:tetratricopeptide (TPR) repeat protein
MKSISNLYYYLSLFNSCVIAICIIFVPKISSASTADKKAVEGMTLYQNQKFNQASKKFYEAQLGKPNDPKISYNLGNSRYKQGNYEKALQNYSRSMEQDSNLAINQKALYNMGNTFFRMNKFEESINAYKKVLELDPSDMDAKFNLEFAREQVKKKQNQTEKKSSKENQKKASRKNKNSKKNEEQPGKKDKQSFPPDKKENGPESNQNKNNQNIRPSEKNLASQSMTREEAEQKLSSLTENLKSFQRKQALEMKSLFTYQGKDW